MFEYPVVFVDIETTGGSYRTSRVLEVAAIRFEHSVITRELSTLLNPGVRIPPAITTITGITDDDIMNAPAFEEIADELHEVLDGAVFVAHNVRFDYSFLKNEFALAGLRFNPKLLCTVRLSRALYRLERGHSLAKLIERHTIPVRQRHRALADAQAIMYFTQLAFEQHGAEAFNQAVAHQLKSQYVPPNLDVEQVTSVDNATGVYIFKDEAHRPIYVGKSVSLRKRIISHFQDASAKELKIAQSVHSIETIVTGSELAALLLESKLVKELQPLYNRQLRRTTSYAMLIKTLQDSYATITIRSGRPDAASDLSLIYGIYPTRTKARQRLEEITRTFELCPKLMGLEKATGACFWYSLGRCRGACIGHESAASYNARFETALQHNRISQWPFASPVSIPINESGESVIINNWMIYGYTSPEGAVLDDAIQPAFDIDEYKIIKRFLKDNTGLITPHDTSETGSNL